MNKELIEKLKDNKKAFGLMSPEEQECLKKVGKKNCMFYDTGGWRNCGSAVQRFNATLTYAIKPDYQPEPEYVDLEIMDHTEENDDRWLVVWRDRESMFLPYPCTHLHCLPSLPDFEDFYSDYSKVVTCIEISMQSIAKVISEGKTVYARFRK